MASHQLEYRSDIQGLRAIAVMLVVFGHYGVPGFSGGFVGVDVFFVLSGFLITGLLAKEHQATGRILYGAFLIRRIRRLFPALLLMLLSVLIAAAFLLGAYELEQLTLSFPFALTWTSNLYFAFVEHQYFDAIRAQDLFLHTWSLGVEEQFYLFWPLLLIASFGVARRFVKGGGGFAGPLVAFTVVSIGGIALNVWWYPESQLLSFYMMPTRAWQFALGASIWLIAASPNMNRTSGSPKPGVSLLLALIGIVLLGASSVLLSENVAYPGIYALAPSVAAALLIAAGAISSSSTTSRVLSSRPMVWVGDRSYSLYLWHWPVLVIGNTYGLFGKGADIVWYVLVIAALSAASYKFVEYPIWKGRFRRLDRRHVGLGVLTAVVLSLGLYRLITVQYVEPKSTGETAESYNPRTDRPKEIYDSGRECDSSVRSAELVPCDVGGRNGTRTAVLLGDSIGVQWTPMLRDLLDASEWRVQVLTKSACPIVDETLYYDVIKSDYMICTDWRNNAIEYLTGLEPELVVIGSSAGYELTAAQWIEGTARILGQLSGSAVDVVVIPGTPRLSFDGPSCLQNPGRHVEADSGIRGQCAEHNSDTRATEVAGYLEEAASGHKNVHVLAVEDLVCPGHICAAENDGGIVVYRDTSHLTVRFVRSIAGDMRRRFELVGVLTDHSQD